jgi:hypothetical protein
MLCAPALGNSGVFIPISYIGKNILWIKLAARHSVTKTSEITG